MQWFVLGYILHVGVLGFDGTCVLLGCCVCVLVWRGGCCDVRSSGAAKRRGGVGVECLFCVVTVGG